MSRQYDYIFWDLDGTIMDTFEGISAGLQYALAFFGIRETDESIIRTFIGPPLRDSIPQRYALDRYQTEVAVEKYREFYEDGGMFLCRPYPGVVKVLEKLKKQGYRQIVTSSKPEVMCRKILEKFKLTDFFDAIVGASLDGKIDTKQEVLEEAFRRMSLNDRSRVVLIGDTKYDAQGARLAGIACIGITYGFGSRQDFCEYEPAAVFDSIEEAEGYINKN
ncbi:5'-nucleotidase [uncultured Roseburia sp.]|uniref:HAD hydrolase-like protein n=1 Tax=Brotonthovivens ammoniilytica TaxID=2981725 RepID=A0ABT2TGP1_9FIRM|nr:HAD hydrolase-like protein [Brotonthovivens ammoniilytica]MCU6760891.1 HAD hydrolase-like protein [Brotonthovivens ammoniilytica]SCI12428.1 5'-nucleotidase [uncultured Roseburia sp.]